ncbi:MAG: hypothetical protein ACRDPZ_13890 [Gaiellaceae bacterium]
MKGIGAFVVVLLVALGVVMYVVTRPPSRELDAQSQAWVDGFEAWRTPMERKVERATVGLTFASRAANDRLLEPLRTCTRSLLRLGPPPDLVVSAHEAAVAACGRAEHAAVLNERFDTASLATIRLHLNEAGDQLRLAARNLRVALGGAS